MGAVAYVIAEPCIGEKDNSCVEVCPVDCIHPTPDEPDYEDASSSSTSIRTSASTATPASRRARSTPASPRTSSPRSGRSTPRSTLSTSLRKRVARRPSGPGAMARKPLPAVTDPLGWRLPRRVRGGRGRRADHSLAEPAARARTSMPRSTRSAGRQPAPSSGFSPPTASSRVQTRLRFFARRVEKVSLSLRRGKTADAPLSFERSPRGPAHSFSTITHLSPIERRIGPSHSDLAYGLRGSSIRPTRPSFAVKPIRGVTATDWGRFELETGGDTHTLEPKALRRSISSSLGLAPGASAPPPAPGRRAAGGSWPPVARRSCR